MQKKTKWKKGVSISGMILNELKIEKINNRTTVSQTVKKLL